MFVAVKPVVVDRMFAQDLPESIIKRYSIDIKRESGVNLGQGIPSYPTAPHVIRAAKRALDDPTIGVYPNFLGTLNLREAIATRLNTTHSLSLQADKHILVTVGAMEAMATTILSIVGNNEYVGVITPNYCNHFPEIQLARGNLVEIPMNEGQTWSLDLDHIKKVAKKLTLLVITNPSNPTGAVISRSQLKQLVTLARTHGFWIVSDETYAYLTYGVSHTSLVDFYDAYDRLITVQSFSKEYAMTGWRVGYVVSRPQTISILAKTHDALVGCTPKISQRAALAALTGTQAPVARGVRAITKRRDIVCTLLDSLSDHLSYITPKGAYYVFPRYTKSMDAITLTQDIMKHAGVAVIPGSVFGTAGEGHIRISFAVDTQTLRRGMKRLHSYFTA